MSATPASDDGEVTHLLNAPGRDELDADVHHQRFSRVHDALHHIARRQRARWKGSETLSATGADLARPAA